MHRLVLGAVPDENVGILLDGPSTSAVDRMAEVGLVGVMRDVSNLAASRSKRSWMTSWGVSSILAAGVPGRWE